MILQVPAEQADSILGAMVRIASVHGAGAVTDADRRTIAAAATIVFGRPAGPPPAPRTPGELAATLADPDGAGDDAARQAVRMLAVLALVDGRIEPDKIALVAEYAAALDVGEAYLHVLAEAAAGEIAAAAACMIRRNAESFPHLDLAGLDADPVAPFLPYTDGRDDPALAARYAALAGCGPGTFGRAFFDHFQLNRFPFPGEPFGLAEAFTTPHDSSHVLSGYTTSPQGELLVSTFIGAMHPDHPMAAEVLPVLFSWHLGVGLNEIAGRTTGAFEPRSFWTAWERGSATTTDVVAPDWDFWSAVDVPLDELRAAYGVLAVDDALRA